MKQLSNVTDKVLSKLKELGADMAQCSAKTSETKEFNVDCNEFSLYRTLFDKSLSMVAYMNKCKGAININHFDDEAIQNAANDCIDAAKSGNPDDAWQICDTPVDDEFECGIYEPDMDKFFERTKELVATIKEKHPKINVEQMIAAHTKENVIYKNSYGVSHKIRRGEYSIMLMYSAHEGEKSSSFADTSFCFTDLSKPIYEMSTVKKDLTDIEKQIDTNSVPGKFEGVAVITPGCLYGFVEDIISNFAGESSLIEGTSIWKDKLNERVADERITISAKPFDKSIICGERYTHEGYTSTDYDIIKDGILKSFKISNYGANKLGLNRSANTSSNIIVQNGDKKLDDIIKSIDKGIIVGRFSGGSPAGNGDFSGVAKNSFLIENGKITCAISETMVNGNLADMLKNVYAISEESVEFGYTTMPYVAFSGITISGK
ncbi:MAG: TldD/PmbA family protein [Acutalibacteraceae bacterium]